MSKFNIVCNKEYELEGEENLNNLLLHFKWKKDKFTRRDYEELLIDWVDIIEILKEEGIEEVFSFVPSDNEKICKWQIMFGLSPFLRFKEHILFRRKL